MSRQDLEALAKKYRDKAERAYENYQETGISRYNREREKNEDLAEALTMAADAVEEHQALTAMRGSVCEFAAKADRAIREKATREEMEAILRNFVTFAAASGVYRRYE